MNFIAWIDISLYELNVFVISYNGKPMRQKKKLQGVPKKRKLLKSLIVKVWMPYEKAERNDA